MVERRPFAPRGDDPGTSKPRVSGNAGGQDAPQCYPVRRDRAPG